MKTIVITPTKLAGETEYHWRKKQLEELIAEHGSALTLTSLTMNRMVFVVPTNEAEREEANDLAEFGLKGSIRAWINLLFRRLCRVCRVSSAR